MTDGAKPDLPPLATDAEMDAWAAAGRADPGGLEVLWHAHHAQRRGMSEDDCPFGDEASEARARWLDVFRAAVKAVGQRHQRGLDRFAEGEPDRKGQWWMEI